MLASIRRKLRELGGCYSGNATLMVALGIPALVGGSGLAVDTAQWYMWKRELQYAVDQAALAGAFARVQEHEEDNYEARALTEYAANMNLIRDNASAAAVELVDFNGGDDNSVYVSASVTDTLPFSSFLTGRSTTVAASAQAAYEDGERFTSCIIAVDEDADGAVTIGGNASLTARCGIAALSDSDQSIIINGQPTVDVGWVLSRGGIDDWLSQYTDAEIHEGVEDLVDPFEGISPPDNPTPRQYECPRASSTTTATGEDVVTITTKIYKGNSKNGVSLISTTAGTPQTYPINRPATRQEVTGTTTLSDTKSVWSDAGNRANPRYTRTDTITQTVRTITVTTVTSDGVARLQPGTYRDLQMHCATVFEPGIYVVDGGDFITNAQYSVTGNGVMFVLRNGAGFRINGGADVNLTAMTAGQLLSAYSVPAITTEQANHLAGMLIFEDPESEGNRQGNRMNGNAQTVLNGTIYLPKSDIEISGTARVTSQCLMIAALTVTLTGTADMATFCPPDLMEDTEVTTGRARVRLVS